MVPLAEDIDVEGGTIVACCSRHNQHQNNIKVFAVRNRKVVGNDTLAQLFNPFLSHERDSAYTF